MAPVDTCCAPFAALRVAAASGHLSQEFATESDWALVFTLQGGQVVRYRAYADTAAMGRSAVSPLTRSNCEA
jgi:hypothetical protein